MESLPIINLSYETYKEIFNLVSCFPKIHRYSLGESVEQSILELLNQLIMAKNAPKPLKTSYLIQGLSALEITTLKMRLILELKLANETKIFQIQAKLQEIGRMLGGWKKSLN